MTPDPCEEESEIHRCQRLAAEAVEGWPIMSEEAQKIGDVVEAAIQKFQEMTTEGDYLGLVDMLTPHEDSNIARGKERMEALIDEVAGEVVHAFTTALRRAREAETERCAAIVHGMAIRKGGEVSKALFMAEAHLLQTLRSPSPTTEMGESCR